MDRVRAVDAGGALFGACAEGGIDGGLADWRGGSHCLRTWQGGSIRKLGKGREHVWALPGGSGGSKNRRLAAVCFTSCGLFCLLLYYSCCLLYNNCRATWGCLVGT